ncbi:hypothetical protein, partial [Klebsiella pneumoniae]|uniref:hypothetical protein n=1 Tax=Klebsiella pneumoniae TaxID=573 RepID=UPI00200DC77D
IWSPLRGVVGKLEISPVSELTQNCSSTSRNSEDCTDFEELPPKELSLKDWFSVFTEVDE